MTRTESAPARPEAEVERLLCSLRGVVTARVVSNPLGRLDEIHVLALDTLHPKQVVRNVESALAAGLGIVIDRRVVSVAQLRAADCEALLGSCRPPFAERAVIAEDASAADWAGAPVADTDAPSAPAAGAAAGAEVLQASVLMPTEPVVLAEHRYEFVGYDVQHEANRETVVRVTIARGGERYLGTGVGPSTVNGRAQAAARALFSALSVARPAEDVLLENTAVVEAHGRTCVLVSAHGIVGRQTLPLTGAAWLQRSPEEAAILAGLQAVNRWTGNE